MPAELTDTGKSEYLGHMASLTELELHLSKVCESFKHMLSYTLITHRQDLLEATSQKLIAQMYPEVQVIRGSDQSIDQLHASNLQWRQTKRQRKREKLIRKTENNNFLQNICMI